MDMSPFDTGHRHEYLSVGPNDAAEFFRNPSPAVHSLQTF